MKKLIAILLATLMLFSLSLSFAETAPAKTHLYYDGNLYFDVIYPEGYEVSVIRDGVWMTIKMIGGEDAANVEVLVCPDEELSEMTSLNDLSDEELADTIAAFTEDYNNPTTSIMETGLGTKVIRIEENDAESDYVEILGLYRGYLIDVYISYEDGREVTEADVETALQFCTDWDFIYEE